jgi:hypothetical protein
MLLMLADPLVDQLGSPSFEKREAAQRALDGLGSLAQPALLRGVKSDDLEKRRRCERALCNLETFGLVQMPRIDCMPEVPGLEGLPEARKRLEIVRRKVVIEDCIADAVDEVGRHTRPSVEWLQRRATVYLTRQLLKQGRTRMEVRKLLLQMEQNEEKRRVEQADPSVSH